MPRSIFFIVLTLLLPGIASAARTSTRISGAPAQSASAIDTTPPAITITSPQVTRGVNLVSKETSLPVTGKATDASGVSSVTVNGQPSALDENGNFSAELLLKPGENQITVSATDIYRNSATQKFVVSRQAAQVAATKPALQPLLTTGSYHALIIGVKDYTDSSIRPLDHPLADAQKIYDTLIRSYTFEPDNVTFLKNPDRDRIVETLDALAGRISENDNLLIFYAGHGFWDERLQQGYWLPADARKDLRSKWLSNSTIREYIQGIKSKHTLLVADACFSGGIFKTRSAFDGQSRAIQELLKLPSRKAMTSGNMKEVPDRSVFVEYLLKRLKENPERYVSSEQLFSSFRQAVINNSPNAQIPLYGEIRETGDEGGDFVFEKRP